MPQMRASTLTQMISGTKSENSGKVIFTHEKKVCLQNDGGGNKRGKFKVTFLPFTY
jgi:hypothetical protein